MKNMEEVSEDLVTTRSSHQRRGGSGKAGKRKWVVGKGERRERKRDREEKEKEGSSGNGESVVVVVVMTESKFPLSSTSSASWVFHALK